MGDSDLSCIDRFYLYDGQDENAEAILELQFESADEGFMSFSSTFENKYLRHITKIASH